MSLSATLHQLSVHDAQKLNELSKVVSDARDDAEKLNALKAYHQAFDAHYDHVDQLLQKDAHAISTAEEDAQKEADEANAAENEVALLQKELDDLKAAQPTSGSGDSVRETLGAPYALFLEQRSQVHCRLINLDAIVTAITKPTSVNIFLMSTNEAKKLQEVWDKESDEIDKLIMALSAGAVALKVMNVASDTSTDEVTTLWDTLKGTMTDVKARVDEEQNRANAENESLKEFEFERKRLLMWCRQQKTNLDTMLEPDHIQEFCASLVNNYPAMEENFTIILERAEPLIHLPSVQAALTEANEVWLNLQVSAYERLRHTLLEIHQSSKLEDEVRAFSDFSTRAGEFLKEFSKLLATPTDDESVTVVKPVVDNGNSLYRQFEQHVGLTEALREFSLRVECLRDNYHNLRRAVFGKLTFLSSGTPSMATSLRRKDEYIERMQELKRWVEVKSQGASWADIHGRVLKIRDLIQQEQESLHASPPVDPSKAQPPQEPASSPAQNEPKPKPSSSV